MRNSLILSAILHVALFVIAYVGLPVILEPLPPPPMVIPVEITEIGAITNTKLKETKVDPKPTPPQPPKKEPKPAPPPPQQKPPEEIKKPEPKQEPKPEEEQAEALPDKKKPKEEKKKPEEKPKPQTDQLASVLRNLAKLKQQTPTEDKKPETKQSEAASEPVSNLPSVSDRLSISEEDALRRQISQCWNMPVGARNAEELIVEVVIEVNPDRTVRSAEIADMSRMSDSYYRAAAESALRALRNPRCNPLELPPDKYDQWKVIRFNFDPRDMI